MTFRRPAVAAVLLLGLLAPAFVAPCRAEGPEGTKQPRPYGQRTDAFRRLLFELRFQPLESFADLENNPSESLFILLGDPECLSRGKFSEGLRSFVEKGGAVLIATDKPLGINAEKELRDLAGVVVTGETLRCSNPNVGDIYDGSPFCPFVQPSMAMAPLGSGGRPALFRNPASEQPELRVATNAPSRLDISSESLPDGIQSLAYLPRTCDSVKVQPNPNDPEGGAGVSNNRTLFAVGGTVGKGRVLVLADHSIFINRMILPPDNGNLEFAANCLHWLRGGISTPMEAFHAANNPDALQKLVGQRNKVLLWNDGGVNSHFEVPLNKVSLPPGTVTEPAVVAAVDKTLAKLEDSNFFNRKILAGIDDLQEGRKGVLRGVVFLLTLAAVLLLGYLFLWRIRYQWEPSFPFLTEMIHRHQPTLSVLDQRRHAQLRSGNVWEMGHRLAREYFESSGIALTTVSPPRVRLAQGSWRQRWRVRRRLARLWRLARGDKPFSLSPAALKKWMRELEEMKTALGNGTMVLMRN